MHRPSYESIVDDLVLTLAEQRRSRIERQAAYMALARAILADETSRDLVQAADLDAFVTVTTSAA